jgi:hypothetical protein
MQTVGSVQAAPSLGEEPVSDGPRPSYDVASSLQLIRNLRVDAPFASEQPPKTLLSVLVVVNRELIVRGQQAVAAADEALDLLWVYATTAADTIVPGLVSCIPAAVGAATLHHGVPSVVGPALVFLRTVVLRAVGVGDFAARAALDALQSALQQHGDDARALATQLQKVSVGVPCPTESLSQSGVL